LKRYQKRNEELFKGNNLEKIIDASEKLEEDFKRFAYIPSRSSPGRKFFDRD
jgi:hypothetical protein